MYKKILPVNRVNKLLIEKNNDIVLIIDNEIENELFVSNDEILDYEIVMGDDVFFVNSNNKHKKSVFILKSIPDIMSVDNGTSNIIIHRLDNKISHIKFILDNNSTSFLFGDVNDFNLYNFGNASFKHHGNSQYIKLIADKNSFSSLSAKELHAEMVEMATLHYVSKNPAKINLNNRNVVKKLDYIKHFSELNNLKKEINYVHVLESFKKDLYNSDDHNIKVTNNEIFYHFLKDDSEFEESLDEFSDDSTSKNFNSFSSKKNVKNFISNFETEYEQDINNNELKLLKKSIKNNKLKIR